LVLSSAFDFEKILHQWYSDCPFFKAVNKNRGKSQKHNHLRTTWRFDASRELLVRAVASPNTCPDTWRGMPVHGCRVCRPGKRRYQQQTWRNESLLRKSPVKRVLFLVTTYRRPCALVVASRHHLFHHLLHNLLISFLLCPHHDGLTLFRR
jgi:hypothetical protein